MSTRAQVIIKDNNQELWFYRHSDGYPKGTLPTLEKFLNWVKEGKIRKNVEQAAGWLILIGAKEYNVKDAPVSDQQMYDNCGSYEPCACKARHGDVHFLYTIDLIQETLTCEEIWNT